MAQPVGALLPHAPATARAHAPAAGALVAQPSDGLSQAPQPSQGSLGGIDRQSGGLTSAPSGNRVVDLIPNENLPIEWLLYSCSSLHLHDCGCCHCAGFCRCQRHCCIEACVGSVLTLMLADPNVHMCRTHRCLVIHLLALFRCTCSCHHLPCSKPSEKHSMLQLLFPAALYISQTEIFLSALPLDSSWLPPLHLTCHLNL